MARYPLNLPVQLKQEAEEWAARQGVSLNQFIMWAVAEKVGALDQSLDDPVYPGVTYRRGAAGIPVPVLRGTGIRVQTLAAAVQQWGLDREDVAAEYGLTRAQVEEALGFYRAHQGEIDALVAGEVEIEESHVQAAPTP
jgi:uncharacterized protein (DUF433 family)